MSNISLGQTGVYVSGETGNRKAAQVIATHEDTREGTSLHVEEGTVNLRVLSPTNGKPSFRSGVVLGKEAFDAAVEAAEIFEPTYVEDEEGYGDYDYSDEPSRPVGYFEAN